VSRLPLGKAGSIDLLAGLLALPFAASNPTDHPPLGYIAEALNELGWRHSDRSPVEANDVRWAIEDTFCVLDNITTGPPSRRWSERHRLSGVAAELAREALLDR
jgi:hypothetical protein